MSIKVPKKAPINDPDSAGQAVSKTQIINTANDTGKSSKPTKAMPTFEQQVEDEINKRVKKGK